MDEHRRKDQNMLIGLRIAETQVPCEDVRSSACCKVIHPLFFRLQYLQESCMWVEMHNDSKKLLGGLKEVLILPHEL